MSGGRLREPIRFLVFSASLRRDSLNTKLADLAATAVEANGGDVTVARMRDFDCPSYDLDVQNEEGFPPGAEEFRRQLEACHGFVVASPEYNASMPGALKNAIDWVSRPEPGRPPLYCFTGKVCGLLSASPGALGGLRGLVTVRSILANIGVLVLPEQVAVMRANDAFGPDGTLKDEKQQAAVQKLAARLVEVAGRLRA